MAQEEAQSAPEPHVRPWRPGVDGATLLRAVERVGADVAALTRLLASQPEEVAARVDVDAATAAIGVRVGALGSTLDQLRLTLLAGLDRTTDRLDRPPWLPRLQASLAELGSLPSDDELRGAIADLTARLDAATPARDDGLRQAVADLVARLERAATEPAERLDRIEAALAEVVEAARAERPAAGEADAAVAAIGTRLGVLGSTLDQLRRSVLLALDQADERLEPPPWLPQLEARLAELAAGPAPGEDLRDALAEVAGRIERSVAEQPGSAPVLEAIAALAADPRLGELTTTVDRLAGDPRLDHLTATVERLADDARLGQMAGALERLAEDHAADGRRLEALAAAVASLSDGVRAGAAVADALEHVGERLGAVASQVDRITPLARAGDEAGSRLGQLERLTAGLETVAGQLAAAAAPPAGAAGGGEGEDHLGALVQVLAGVTRRQDEVGAAIATVLDQVRGPMGVDAVVDRMEQRERSLAGRLDRIDSELRRRSDQPPSSSAQAGPRPDETARALRAVLERLDHQERAVAGQLEWIVQRLATPPPALAAGDAAPFGELLAGLSRRQDELAATIDRRLSAIESGLAATGGRPSGLPPTSAEAAAFRLAQLRAERARVQAHLRDERLLAAQSWNDEEVEG